MRLDMSQQMKMDQRMVLAPRMIQSMEILQLPLMALQERIEQEMITNPVLELEEPAAEVDSSSRDSADNNPEIDDNEKTLLIQDDNSKKEDFERLENIGPEFSDYWDRSSYVHARANNGERDPKLDAMQNTVAHSQSLNEHLHNQWSFIECDPVIKKAGAVIIDNIDENGYLTVELESLSELVREPVTLEQMEKALSLVQTLEPNGVGARNLAECLLIQLQNSPQQNDLAVEIIKNHIKDLEMNRYPAIAKKTGHTVAEIKEAVQLISHLDPHPGLQIGSRDTAYIVPDVIVEYDEDNDVYTARLADGSNPMLRINKQYHNMLKEGKINPSTKEFLQNSIRSARWLIESIEQRKATLLRVVNIVLRTQKDFFHHGHQYLKPLPMVEVAEELGIHVGTVSRAVSGKYLQTPIGIFPLRFFFSGGTENDSGESVSWDAIKAKLQEIVDNEDKNNPYNDDQLVAELKKHGLSVARRTVAKYRSLLHIPPARRRKVYT